MIGLDLDGTILNYNGHSEKIEVNYGLLKLLPDPGRPVVIVTNQGGLAFSYRSQELGISKYPTPEQVAARLRAARRFLNTAGYPVVEVSVSTYHPKASMDDIVHAAASLEKEAYFLGWTDTLLHVYTTPLSRKPEPLMLQEAGVTIYYGDSPEDAEAAKRAGVDFVPVPRFLGVKGGSNEIHKLWLKPGTQIIYVPNHADGDANHPDCEPGFVERDSGERALCRFWLKPDLLELRTKANGEWAMKYNLVVKDTVPQIRVNKAMNDDQEADLYRILFDRDGHGDANGVFGGDGHGHGYNDGCGWGGSTCGDGDSNASDNDRKRMARVGPPVIVDITADKHGVKIHRIPVKVPKVIEQETKMDKGLNIVVLDRGFVYIGRVTVADGWVSIEGAYNIRRWGTTNGLGQLVNGPTEHTVLDQCGTVEAPLHALIHLIPVSEEAWKSYYS